MENLLQIAEKIDRTAAAYRPEPGKVAYQFAAQRDQIAAGVEAWSGAFSAEAREARAFAVRS